MANGDWLYEPLAQDVIPAFSVRTADELFGFRRIASNPFIAGPPVKTDAMFFGRRDLLEFLRSAGEGEVPAAERPSV